MTTKTKRLRKNDANLCRLKGWTAGTILTVAVEEFPGRTLQIGGRDQTWEYRITAIAEEGIVVRQQLGMRAGKRERSEKFWVHTLVTRLVLKADRPDPDPAPAKER